jgi:hypothetical protein
VHQLANHTFSFEHSSSKTEWFWVAKFLVASIDLIVSTLTFSLVARFNTPQDTMASTESVSRASIQLAPVRWQHMHCSPRNSRPATIATCSRECAQARHHLSLFRAVPTKNLATSGRNGTSSFRLPIVTLHQQPCIQWVEMVTQLPTTTQTPPPIVPTCPHNHASQKPTVPFRATHFDDYRAGSCPPDHTTTHKITVPIK